MTTTLSLFRPSLLVWLIIGSLAFSSSLDAQRLPTQNPLTLRDLLQSDLVPSTPPARLRSQPESTQKERITRVTVTGNIVTDRATIMSHLFLREGTLFSRLKLNRNVKNIQSLGLFSSVRSSVNSVSGGKEILITVKENPVIGEIVFSGSTVYPKTTLLQHIRSATGNVFSKKDIRYDIESINALYEKDGYIRSRVSGVRRPTRNGAALIFDIAEARIESVSVTGNEKTQSYVVLREMDSVKGSLLNANVLAKDFRRIFNLGYFNALDPPEIIPGTSENAYILNLHLTDKPTNASFTLGGGYSPTSGFSLFTDLFWDNLFGTGQTILLKTQFGRATTYQIKYHNPWMWDKRKSFTFKTWLRNGDVDTVNPANQIVFRDELSVGVDVGVGVPLTEELRLNQNIKLEGVELRDVSKKYSIQSYRMGLSFDTRDVKFNPIEGSFHTLNVEKGFTLASNSLNFLKTDVELRQFFKTFERQTIATRFAYGRISSPEIHDHDLFAREIYRVGGANTVRGYSDLDPFAQGSQQMLFNVEYRFLFNDTFQAILFVDTGYATYGTIDLSRFQIGKGVGLRMVIPPLGPIRLDLGIDDLGVTRVHFSMGHTF